jgi:DNA primase
LEMLANRANLELPKEFRGQAGSPRNQENKQALTDALIWAENEFHQFLLTAQNAQRARTYLDGRGFTQETLKEYRVGYHPNEWEWLLNRANGKFSREILQAARLVTERRDGSGYRDEFVDRVVFPIHDDRSRAVAFGGRILPDNTRENAAKYWNSPESPVFTKSRLLYGLDLARDAIRKEKTAIVVEGYTDCIMIHQHGVANVVATLGTALGESHVQLLRRFAQRVVLVYDGDDPGQRAAERAVAQFISQEVDLRVLTLPVGQDPADFLQEQGVEAFRGQIENAVEAWEYKLQAAVRQHGLKSVDGRHRVLNEMVELFTLSPRLSGTVREDIILGKLSRKLDLPERKLRQIIADARRKPNNQRRRQPTGESFESASSEMPVEMQETSVSGGEELERELLEIIFAAPETVERIAQEIGVADIRNHNLRTLLQVCFDIAEQGELPAYDRVTSAIEEPALKRLAVEIDEVASQKDLGQKLRLDSPSLGLAPSLLDEVINRLKWTRRSNLASKSNVEEPAIPADSGNLGPDAKARLRQLTELRQADPAMKLRLETGRNR